MLSKSYAVIAALLICTFQVTKFVDAGFPYDQEDGKVLLFSIDAHSGKNALNEFRKSVAEDTIDETGKVFRSSLLNNLAQTVNTVGASEIVAEMRNGDTVVASATFDVSRDSDKLTSENWFTKDRLVKSYPYWIGKGHYQTFSIAGNSWGTFQRNFYIQFVHGGCGGDVGFMGIGDSLKEPCGWANRGLDGTPPVLFYSKRPNVAYEKGNVYYAERFVVYFDF